MRENDAKVILAEINTTHHLHLEKLEAIQTLTEKRAIVPRRYLYDALDYLLRVVKYGSKQ